MTIPIQLTFTKEELPMRYLEIKLQNPMLERMEKDLKLSGFTDEEIRTMQLLIACASNASLQQRIKEMEVTQNKLISTEAGKL